MTYENLLTESADQNLIVKEKDLPGYKGRIYKNRIAIRKNLTTTEKSCILAEELGHHYTTYGNILDQTNTGNHKQEMRARLWAYNKKIGLQGFIRAYEAKRTDPDELAEFLDVTPEFLTDALNRYKSIYGPYTTLDNYVIFFEPCLAVMEIFNR